MDVDADSAKVTFPPPLVYLGFLLGGLAADRVLSLSLHLPVLTRAAAAVPLIVAGVFLMLAAAGRFRAAGTEVKPWKTTTTIVDHGVYGMTRNPMYLAMALLYLGLALACASLGALVLLPVVMFIIRTQVIAREERYLEAKFGDSYRAYKARVRRWI